MTPIYPKGYMFRHSKELRDQRLVQMVSMYNDKKTFAAIGVVFNLTKQRVSQIFQENDVPVRNTHGRRR